MSQRVHIVVSGQVQGVSFRAYTEQVARSLGLRGFVRNLPLGGVEIVAEGEPAALARLVAWARHGPPAAEVTDLDVSYSESAGSFRDFSIRL